MELREITIQAIGCHDCELCYMNDLGNFWCKYINCYLDEHYISRTFHPNCPMKVKEE